VLTLPFLYISCSQDSELSYAHRDGRLLELIDEAWQRDELPNDGMESTYLKDYTSQQFVCDCSLRYVQFTNPI